MADLTWRDSGLSRESAAAGTPGATGAPYVIGRLAPLIAPLHPWRSRLVVGAIGRLGARDARSAAAAAQVLQGLVYAGDARLRAVSVTALARLAARYPTALGAPPWRWRAQVAAAAAEDPRLLPAATRLLAVYPGRPQPMPAREAWIWEKLGRPAPLEHVA